MSIVPNDATLCAGPGPHAPLGVQAASLAERCPTCGGRGWYVEEWAGMPKRDDQEGR